MANPNPNKRWKNPAGGSAPAAPAARVVDNLNADTIAAMTPAERAGFSAACTLIARLLLHVEPLPAGQLPRWQTERRTPTARPAKAPNRPTPIQPSA